MVLSILAILEKEMKVILRDRQALALLFAMPAFFILVMSYALEGVFEAGSRSRPLEVLVVNLDEGPVTQSVREDWKALAGLIFHESLDGRKLNREKGEALVRQGAYPLALVFPKGFSNRILGPSGSQPGVPPTIEFIHDPATNERLLAGVKGLIEGVIQRRVMMASWAGKLGKAYGIPSAPMGQVREPAPDESLPRVTGEILGDPEVVFMSVPPRGLKTGRNPTATEQNVPAYTIFGVF
ncbi:MAG: hypothetical protein MUF69_14890, partial [Desulfobacterota bacterium]|nr:hypothetical protein [Thermodesulfobacteriota bacterium]